MNLLDSQARDGTAALLSMVPKFSPLFCGNRFAAVSRIGRGEIVRFVEPSIESVDRVTYALRAPIELRREPMSGARPNPA